MTAWTKCRASCIAIARALLIALKESIQPQGARGLYLQQAASTDWALEEAQLNICMVCELFVQILASGLGALALVWATVVLLGGFSTSLEGTDFWVITAIVFIQTARVVGINVSPEAEFFNQVPPVFLELGRRRRATPFEERRRVASKGPGIYKGVDYINIMSVFGILVLAMPTIAGLSCISLSIYRLMALLSTHHVNSNVFRALMLFYALVVLQGGLFIIWFCMRLYRSYLAYLLRLPYRLDVKRELVDKYMDKTFSTAIENGVPSTINMNLASFALDLIKSDYSQDHTEAVYLIHTLTSKEHHRRRTLSQIQSSPLCISRLLDMVTSTDQRTKICIAEIVVHLASNLHLADISGATESISSMIDPYFTKISTPATNVNIDHQTSIDITNDMEGTPQSSSTTSGAERKPLIIYGLLILAKLAVNPDNCKQIYDSRGLLFKIISPVQNKVYEIPSDDGITMEITEKALEVVSKLVSGKNETSGKIRQDIYSYNIAKNYIRPIMERDHRYNKLKVPATKILTELYLDRYIHVQDTIRDYEISEFIKVLMNIFLDVVNESGLRKTVGKTLVELAMDSGKWSTILNFSTGTESSVLQLLTAMIPEESNRLYRTAIAQLLARFLANLDSIAERNGLESIKTIFTEVLKVICNVEQAGNTIQECSPQHNSGQPTFETITLPRRHNSLPRPRPSHEVPGGSLPAAAQLVGGRRKSLAAFLGLTLQICDKLKISADDFDTALLNIPLSMDEFIDKLNDIIEQCKVHSVDSLEGKRPSVDYLVIINNVTKLCLWMMDTKPDCIKEFQDKNTSAELQGALEDMRDLELGMILTGNVGDVAHYQTLSTMVAAARQKMDANVIGMSG